MRFPDIYTGRVQHAGWSVIQAGTLIDEAKARHSSSLLIYAALELRLAIEQLVYTIIVVAQGKADEATLRACRRPGGLFRVLAEVTPRYTLKCKFSRELMAFYPEIPQGAEWDVKFLVNQHAVVTEICQAQRVIRGMGAPTEPWDDRLTQLTELHAVLAAGMKKDTAVLSFKGATPQALTLWRKYSTGKISLKELRRRFASAKTPLVSRQPSPRPYPLRAPALPHEIPR